MTSNDTTKDTATKAAALRLLARGLITQSEAARLAGVSRQLVAHWAKGLDVEPAREARLAQIWSKSMGR